MSAAEGGPVGMLLCVDAVRWCAWYHAVVSWAGPQVVVLRIPARREVFTGRSFFEAVEAAARAFPPVPPDYTPSER